MEANAITIEQVEAAINAWRARRPSTDGDARLCREARVLAEPYTWMIMNRQAQIPLTALTAEQQAALDGRSA
ncbi:DUF3717 domain-containing protein (plasmid) [Burkholderia plantarii]|uniref:DUF3717 domain-containing protein n=1 Tax=Burkholderia plantarii TaxID=41899 RepID=UPI00272A313D|nr:DUF3717 domain-containing protein [Burkholderia plantarii]WLE64160.1 DUF3717 domain-containing protein [Burkholderia plantarii]